MKALGEGRGRRDNYARERKSASLYKKISICKDEDFLKNITGSKDQRAVRLPAANFPERRS